MSSTSGHHRHGKRGRHKKRTSPEARRWEAEHMQPPRPPWCPPETWQKLMQLREQS